MRVKHIMRQLFVKLMKICRVLAAALTSCISFQPYVKPC